MRVADGYDSAIIGYAYNPISRKNVVGYEVDKILKILFERDGMSLDDAEEFFNFNIVGSYVGEQTPIFVYKANRQEIDEIADMDNEDSDKTIFNKWHEGEKNNWENSNENN